MLINLVRRCPAHCRQLYTRDYHARSTTPSKGDKVIVAMSGGVDSSVTAKILSDTSNGYDLCAVFMRNWDTRDESGSDEGCEWKKDWEDVQKVCRMLDIPVKMIDLSREYWLRVFEPSLRDWASGLSPNPDVWCNREVKFGALLDSLAKESAFSNAWLATGTSPLNHAGNRAFLTRAIPGHYAHKTWDTSDHLSKPRPMLRKPSDSTKDQTYYLSSISENSLSRALFPLSQVDKGSAQYIVPKPGPIVDMTTGKQAGIHDGLWSYTIGQGARISGMPQRMFVAKKDPETNTIFIVPGADHPALYVESIRIRDFSWIWADGEPRKVLQPFGLEARVKYRHCMTDVPCIVHRDTQGLHIIFRTPQKGIAPGQIATIYSDDCLSLRAFSDASDVTVEDERQGHCGRGSLRVAVHAVGEYDQGEQAGFSSGDGTLSKLFLSFARSAYPLANTCLGSPQNRQRQLYGVFLDKMKELYVPDRIKDGQFGAMMDVSLTNEGPVTFTLDTRKFEYITPPNGDGEKGEKKKVKGDSPRSAEPTQPTPASGGES
ncbi:tRNA methyl transferase-domain-containing protein [Butyriboletus roseoflavus]|nr:tRNA methyl transferase-domain-containing protein [Butyriboletus roseoflavus]